MGFLSSAANTPASYPQYTGLQLQTSSGAVPIAICYGTNKIAPNVIWTGNFTSHAVYAGGGKGGGKGGLFGGGSPSGYDYTAAVMLGLCEGPVGGVGTVWNGQSLTNIASGASKSTSFNGLMLFNGATPQTTWGYLASQFPSQALSYNGLAYAASADYDLGSAATVDALSFETYGALISSAVVNGYDADPALVIQDFLTNPQYGVGFPAASIAAATLLGSSGDSSYQTYCRAVGLALSPALTDQEAASSILARWLQLTNTAAIWSSGLLKFIPYGDAAVTGALFAGVPGAAVPGASAGTSGPGTSFVGGTCTFNPDLTPIYNLGDDDYVYEDGKDPVNVERSDPYAAYNMQILEIFQRSNYYDATPMTAFDQNAIELYGLRIAATVTAHEICDPNVAQTAAQLILQRGLYIRNHYAFKLSWEYCLLEPMDLVTLTDANLGLSNIAVRITEIEEDEDGLLSITAEEFPGGTATAVAYPVQTNVNVLPFNRTAVPDSVNAPLIFEPPASLAGSTPQIWIAVSGGSGGIADPNWGGANVWVSLDNASYVAIGQVTAPARQGVLTASLSAYAGTNPDVLDTFAVSLSESGGALASTTAAGAAQAVTLMIVDSEFLAFETATLSAPNSYQLTGLYRGLYGSAISAHAAGAPCAIGWRRFQIQSAKFLYRPAGLSEVPELQRLRWWSPGSVSLHGLFVLTGRWRRIGPDRHSASIGPADRPRAGQHDACHLGRFRFVLDWRRDRGHRFGIVDMSEQLQLRRGTASQIATFTGAQGEVVVDTTNNRLILQDGATAGGFPAAKLSDIPIVGALATLAQGANGSNIQIGALEQALMSLSGASVTSTIQIPNRAIVFAVSIRVITAITGATSFNVDATTSSSGGAGTTAGQFGSSLGTAAGSTNSGIIGPTAWYAASTIKLIANGGNFTAGAVRISIQYLTCSVPAS